MADTASLEQTVDVFRQVTAFLVGLCIGSFLNVVIARMPENVSVVSPRSRCPRCGAGIAWYDNLPVVSWLLLMGKCRNCKVPISIRYPTVELLTGLLFLSVYRLYGFTWLTPFYMVFVALLVVVAYIDLDTWEIYLELVVPGMVLGIVQSFLNPKMTWFDSAVGAAAGFGIFALVAVLGRLAFKKEALGQGDWWLLGMIGAFLGWKALLPVILFASLQGSVVGILLIVLGRGQPGPDEATADKQQSVAPDEAQKPPPVDAANAPGQGEEEEEDWVPPKNAVPFGPFLVLGALEQLLLGEGLHNLYDTLILRLMR
jgi:leader peptidase (prepilin peptidase)/N-methyltransferase